MNKIKMFASKNKVLMVFIFFFILVLFQHQFLYLFHDDFGYASLSYLPGYDGIIGVNTNISDIFNFLIYHYNNWGGRVLYFFIEIVLLRCGLPIYRIVQSLIITGIFYLIYKIVSSKKDNYLLAICSCLCYGLFEIMTFRAGIFWPSAAVLYIFPLLPFLLFVYLYQDNISTIKKVICVLLIFLASWSQEQIGIMSVIYILFLTIHEWILKKKMNFTNIIMTLGSLSGFLILMLAPGSNARLGVTPDFYSLSLMEKLKTNIPNIIFNLFGQYTMIITILFLLIAIYLTYKNIKGVNKNRWLGLINKVSIISSSIILFVTAIKNEGYFDYIYYLYDTNCYKILALIIIFIQLSLILYSIIYYFYKIKDYKYIYLVFGACASQAGMVIAPYYPLRSSIMFDIVIFFLLVYSLKDIYGENKNLFKYLIIILGIISICNFSNITYGYYTNKKVNESNDVTLKETSLKIAAGEQIDEVNLLKLNNELYGIECAYMDGYDYIAVYMRNYYDLPSELKFNYVDE